MYRYSLRERSTIEARLKQNRSIHELVHLQLRADSIMDSLASGRKPQHWKQLEIRSELRGVDTHIDQYEWTFGFVISFRDCASKTSSSADDIPST